MIPLYILGLLLRFGPQHGYQIKKLLAEQLEDFTQIKLPTIYYHLEKMEEAGMIISQNAKEGTRPEKKVYHVSESGCKRFRELLYRTIDIEYRPTFDVDAAFYFSDHIDIEDIIKSLQRHFERLEKCYRAHRRTQTANAQISSEGHEGMGQYHIRTSFGTLPVRA